MKKIRKLAAVLAAGLMLSTTACVPGKEALPEDTIEAYEDACNAMDVQGMLDCMDEKSVKSITAGMDLVMGLAGAVSGVDLGISASDMLDLMPLMQAMLGESFAAQMGGMPQVDFQVQETYIKGDRATVYFTEANSGGMMAVNMVKDSGKWYMSLSTITISKDTADRVIIAGEKEEGQEKLSKEEKNRLFEGFKESLQKGDNSKSGNSTDRSEQEDKELAEEEHKGNEERGEKEDGEELGESGEKASDVISRMLGTDKLKEAVEDIFDSENR